MVGWGTNAILRIAILGGLAATGWSQTGTIYGIVQDSQGLAVPAAKVMVTATSERTGWQRATTTTDLAVLKNFRFSRERDTHLEFRGEFFNAFNQVNFSAPIAVLTGKNFGKIRKSGDPRLVQFGVKLLF